MNRSYCVGSKKKMADCYGKVVRQHHDAGLGNIAIA
jgi:hypothetical protein